MVTKHETRYFNRGALPVEIGFNSLVKENPVKVAASCQPNWHDDLEVIYCTGGEGQVSCRGILYDMKPGDIVVVNANEIHQVQRPERLFEYYFIIISHEFCSDNGIETGFCIFEPMIRDEECRKKTEAVITAYKSAEAFCGASLRLSLLSFLVYLIQNRLVNGLPFYSDGSDKAVKTVMTALTYIRNHFTEKITIDDVAREACVSKYHLSRIFKEHTSRSIVAYINYLRCNYAYKLMVLGQHSISEVCTMCGFGSVSYFDKVFKEEWGYLPSEVRGRNDSRTQRLPAPEQH